MSYRFNTALSFTQSVICGLVLSQQSFAASSTPVVVTATRTPIVNGSAITPTLVINRSDIELSQAQDLTQLLQFQAGLDIARNGGPGQTSSLFIRGTESNHTLVLVDGVEINPGTIGGAALQQINLDMVERIEIVKGPRSTLYGSDAIGGVIHIFTRRGGKGTSSQLKLGTGSDQTRTLSAAVRHDDGRFYGGVDLSLLNTGGFPARRGASTDSGYSNTSINARIGHRGKRFTTELSHWESRGNTEYFGFFLDPLDQDYQNAVSAFTVKGAINNRWGTTIKLSHMVDRIIQNQGGDFATTRRTVFDWQNDFQLNANNLVTVGALLSNQSTRATSFGNTLGEDIDENAAYAQLQSQHGRHQLTLGIRANNHDAFGSYTTWDTGYAYQATPALLLSAMVGTGFRAPDSTDRFGFGGNPNLEPETSRNIEWVARYQMGMGQTFSLSAFQNNLDQLISFDDPDGFLGPIPGRNKNIDKARIRGIEASYSLDRHPWKLNIQATLQDPENRNAGNQLARRAKQSLTVNAAYTGRHYRTGFDALVTSERPDSDFSNTVNSGYTLINFYAEKKLTPSWWLRGRIENLFDQNYTLADQFNTRGRAAFIEIQYKQTKDG